MFEFLKKKYNRLIGRKETVVQPARAAQSQKVLLHASPPPKIKRSFKKVVWGASLFALSYAVDALSKFFSGSPLVSNSYASNANSIMAGTGFYLVIDGGYEILTSSRLICTETETHRNKGTPEVVRYHWLLRNQLLLEHSINILQSAMIFLILTSQMSTKLQQMFSSGEKFDLQRDGFLLWQSTGFIFVPITFVYNLREWLFTWENKDRAQRGTIPILGALNAWITYNVMYIIADRLLYYYNDSIVTYDLAAWRFTERLKHHTYYTKSTVLSSYKSDENTAMVKYYLALFFRERAYQDILKNFFQILFNARNSWFNQADLIVVQKTSMSASTTVARQRVPTAVMFVGPRSQLQAEGNKKYVMIERVSKIKTTGPAAAPQARTFTPSYQDFSLNPTADGAERKKAVEFDEKLRQEKLELLTEYRCLSQLKFQDIEREINTLVKFLPNAKIINIQGSERKLVWSTDDEDCSLKFETPHGLDGNVYKGRKLEKILNVLQAAYLWGWDKSNALNYLYEQNKCTSLERLYSFLIDRPKI